MRCLLSARFSMKADLLRQTSTTDQYVDVNQAGGWSSKQNALSGEVERVWVPVSQDDPSTEEVELLTIDCIARSEVSYVGSRSNSGVRQNFGQDYINIEFVRMTFPPNIIITQRDRITNIRNNSGLLWRDEELEHGTTRATVFDVIGVVPILDPFNNHIENMALLQRTEVQ